MGVVKSIIAELTDETNVARAFSLLPMSWAVGVVIGLATFSHRRQYLLMFMPCFSPFLGGILSRPQDRWPNVFSHPFWNTYPYFLPCLASAAYACVSLIIVANFLQEVRFVLCQELYRFT